MAATVNVLKSIDRLAEHLKNVLELTTSDVLVGIPAAKAGREGGPITNAALAYIHEFGSPAHNIPARPFLIPGVMVVKTQAISMLQKGARDVIQGKAKPEVVLNQVGMLARNSVVKAITDPAPPFKPLKPATIRARLRKTAAGRRKLRGLNKIKSAAGWSGKQSAQALTEWADAGNIKPLIDTGQLRAAITYVVRKSLSPAELARGLKPNPNSRIIAGINASEQKYRR